jgi:hypothetical protein
MPDGSNWKVTMMIEYPDAEERQRMLARLIGIEDKVWLRIEGCERVYAVADEDLERENADKTSSVHFLRLELAPAMVKALRGGAALSAGVDHPNYSVTVERVGDATRASLLADLSQ